LSLYLIKHHAIKAFNLCIKLRWVVNFMSYPLYSQK
jgi:hypothetical protein